MLYLDLSVIWYERQVFALGRGLTGLAKGRIEGNRDPLFIGFIGVNPMNKIGWEKDEFPWRWPDRFFRTERRRFKQTPVWQVVSWVKKLDLSR